jgi:hypothetical protein
MVLATDRRQAKVIMRYVSGLLHGVPMLERLIEKESEESILLNNRVEIVIQTVSFRSARGFTCIGVFLDEIAFWRSDDSANPDSEVIAAMRPSMATIPGAILLAESSHYSRRGALWTAYQRHYGKDSAVLVWQAATRVMNPSVPQSLIDTATDEDSAAASAEYGAMFRSDLEAFVSREAVEACTVRDVYERYPVAGVRYIAFVDPSGGSQDAMTLAISHRQGNVPVLDAVREVKPPFSPESVVREFCYLLKTYRVSEVTGDRYAGEWPREQFRKLGVRYKLSEKTRSDLYRDLFTMLNSGKVELLYSKRLASQLVSL